MGRTRRLFLLTLFLLILVSQPASSLPYWFKEGVYARYVSRSDGENPWLWDSVSIAVSPNGTVTYYCPYVEFTWRVLNVSDGRAWLGLVISGKNCAKRERKTLDEETARRLLREYQERYNFTGGECRTIKLEAGNVTVCEDSYSERIGGNWMALTVDDGMGQLLNQSLGPENFSRGGLVELDMETGELLLNGTPIGRNFLWAENPASITGLEIMPGLKVERVKVVNSTVVTYYGDFHAPLYMAFTSQMAFEGGMGMCVILYDGSSGLAIAFFTPISPLWKALGIDTAMIQDTALAKEHRDEFNGGDKMPPFGLVLAETNVDFTKPAKLPEEGPSKSAVAAAVGTIVLLTLLLVWRWKR